MPGMARARPGHTGAHCDGCGGETVRARTRILFLIIFIFIEETVHSQTGKTIGKLESFVKIVHTATSKNHSAAVGIDDGVSVCSVWLIGAGAVVCVCVCDVCKHI